MIFKMQWMGITKTLSDFFSYLCVRHEYFLYTKNNIFKKFIFMQHDLNK